MKICQQCACPLAGVPSETITWFDLGARSHGSLVCSHGDWLKCEDLTAAAWEGCANHSWCFRRRFRSLQVPSIRCALPQRWEPLKVWCSATDNDGRGIGLVCCRSTPLVSMVLLGASGANADATTPLDLRGTSPQVPAALTAGRRPLEVLQVKDAETTIAPGIRESSKAAPLASAKRSQTKALATPSRPRSRSRKSRRSRSRRSDSRRPREDTRREDKRPQRHSPSPTGDTDNSSYEADEEEDKREEKEHQPGPKLSGSQRPPEPVGPPPDRKPLERHPRPAGSRKRRGGTKHQRHYRSQRDPFRVSHRRLTHDQVELAESFTSGLERRA
eukprot:Skav219723  [mRNA]  locus=scaffold301:131777:140692:+ [translate_table: standard]